MTEMVSKWPYLTKFFIICKAPLRAQYCLQIKIYNIYVMITFLCNKSSSRSSNSF